MLFSTLWGAIVPVIIVRIAFWSGVMCLMMPECTGIILLKNHILLVVGKFLQKEYIEIELSAGDVLHDVTKRKLQHSCLVFVAEV